ncbi:ABC-type amino acid transport substrate-binding protein [Marinobacter gudaonensis]|uniref:ABC-type amino acid transport substrate-binding protein n=2 Tax=Marinobacter gudaonensis TaxID=375760 RepID=A0A1I6GS31_9GAMM|nr:ABC-type amino acid transport substrate-binding protein [Marinobacter gudaonensis]
MDAVPSMTLRLALGLTTALVYSVCQAQAPTLKLLTFESPPYQMVGPGADDSSLVVGETANTVACAANRAGWATRIRIAPQNRAIHSLERKMIDGYFAIDPSSELDTIAKRSDPVALEKWYFFTRDNRPFSRELRIGVVSGSNEEAWLEANGYRIFLSVSSPAQLLALLKRARIDTALMDERVMNRLRQTNDFNDPQLNTHFVRYAPLYLYLSETFTSDNPEFLGAFNRTLTKCMAGQLALSDEEERRIIKLSERLFAELNSILDIRQIIEAGPRQESFTDVMTIDSQWQALSPFQTPDLAEEILALPGSRALHAWQQSHPGLITEVMVVNDMGTLAAISQLTSDYWQGDEPKFQKVMGGSGASATPGQSLFISPIRYDTSAARFQVTVSTAVPSDIGETAEGVIVIGLGIEDALSEYERQ